MEKSNQILKSPEILYYSQSFTLFSNLEIVIHSFPIYESFWASFNGNLQFFDYCHLTVGLVVTIKCDDILPSCPISPSMAAVVIAIRNVSSQGFDPYSIVTFTITDRRPK